MLMVLSPSRKPWWNETVMPFFKPVRRTASSIEFDDLAIELGGWAGEMRRLGGKAGEDFAPLELRQGGEPAGELDCHGLLAFSYFRTPEAAASCKTRWACAITGASTILPFSETTPSPSFSAFAAAATTRRA